MPAPNRLRIATYQLLNSDPDARGRSKSDSRAAWWVQAAIQVLILLNVIAVVVETLPSVQGAWAAALDSFEAVSIAVFVVEYLARLWSIREAPEFSQPLAGRLRWVFTPMALVDLVAIIPALLPWFGADLRSVRIVRVFRILKLGRYSRAVHGLARAFASKKDELAVVSFGVLVLMVIASSVLYYAEHEAQPEAFSSIPAAAWWAVATLTTVGYGDLFPITAIGKFAGALVALSGVGLVALPAGILASAFNERISDKAPCAYCGLTPDAAKHRAAENPRAPADSPSDNSPTPGAL